jgi:hypothetical protein
METTGLDLAGPPRFAGQPQGAGPTGTREKRRGFSMRIRCAHSPPHFFRCRLRQPVHLINWDHLEFHVGNL